MNRTLLHALVTAAVLGAAGCATRSMPSEVALGAVVPPTVLAASTIDGTPIVQGSSATVFYFAGPECPIARAYSPDVARAVEKDKARGITWVMVFPEEDVTAEMIRQFQRDYSLPLPAVTADSTEICCALGTTTIPSVVVVDASNRILYRGRIDNRYKGLGTTYGPPSKRDLDEVTDAIAAGKPLPPYATPAIGCVLPPCGSIVR